MFESIGPVWDGNEVWLVVAGGATFAAFPGWYATMFSGFYIALLLVLVCLIVRVLSFEWRAKSERPRWRTVWTWANAVGSFGASLIWGVALREPAPRRADQLERRLRGQLLGDLFNGYTVVAGLAVVLLFAFHGATFLTLRTSGDLCERASAAARRLSPAAALSAPAFLAWTVASPSTGTTRTSSRRSCRPRSGSRPSLLAVLFVYRRRSGLGVRRDRPSARRARGRHDLHEPLPAGDGLEPRLREQPDRRERLVRRTTRSR